MFIKLRDNLYLGSDEAWGSIEGLEKKKITSVVCVANDFTYAEEFINADSPIRIWTIGLRSDRMNPPHIKDLACHVPKYMMQCGEIVLIQSVTGLKRGAYVACRVLCEQENKTIYEVMQEVQELIPEFDISASYF